ncbi:MAG: hypothetical protein ACLTZY_10945 [Alistipes indistinctus]
MALLAWDFTLNDDFRLQTTFSYLGGESCCLAPRLYGAPNPMPDYYRYMPGYAANPEVAAAVREAWESRDPDVTQVSLGRTLLRQPSRDRHTGFVCGRGRRYCGPLAGSVSSFRVSDGRPEPVAGRRSNP